MESVQPHDNDVIDIKELFETLKEKKRLIYSVTGIITILGIVYTFMWAKPVYEVKAMIEIGKIGAGTKDEITLDNIVDIKEKLTYLYGIKSKKKREYPRVKSIVVAKKSKSIFEIVVEGRDNASAINRRDKVIAKLENSYAQKVKVYIDTKKELIALTQYDIGVNQQNLEDTQSTIKDYSSKILNITDKDAALAGLYTIQISQNQSRVQELQNYISNLKTKEFNLKLSITPLRISKMHIVGEIEVLDNPYKA